MAWDPVWEEVFTNQAWGKYPSEDLIRFVACNFYKVQNRKDIKILEIGCGPGANLWYMAKEGFTVYGIDGSDSAIKQARKRLNEECPGWMGELQVSDFRDIPYKDNTFDAVIDNEAVYSNSFDESKRIYSEMHRVTKSGGKFFSRTFAAGSWGDQTGEKVGHNAWKASEGPLMNKGYSRFTPFEEIQELITDFQIEEVEMVTRSMSNQRHTVKEWIITGKKL
ncbi:class I SAM-dependent methyltransferase [Paenibacillus sp. JMULE4]|uniref:class I SAM-dependent methyltransferase n=1 Tax=Paenibacillus sp. JMULE4 TaxID=2518342 RepID=UPI00157612B8|nr:class I SAM-dependent methyltransferase [Paenibacillus sp. JMULE4]NTZ16377.1 class I SAM-dependent methyltransferase [Paenibacillus sp. JMULE4]